MEKYQFTVLVCGSLVTAETVQRVATNAIEEKIQELPSDVVVDVKTLAKHLPPAVR